jgi:oligopeptidase B
VDVINTMLNPLYPLVLQEYTEWGNPNNETEFTNMLRYDPYPNVKATAYPNLLVTSGTT